MSALDELPLSTSATRLPFLYVIGKEDGPVKVGFSFNPAKRAADLQTGCPFRLQVLYQRAARNIKDAWQHEQIFHDVHRASRLVGEWFSIDAAAAIELLDTGFDCQAYYEERDRISQ